tara:strand:- start:1262 stop:3034 length:1773 start_codon:yes stop_codon:yes gene_type:complete
MFLNRFIINKLEKLGCESVFHVPGGAAFHLIDAVAKSKKLKLVPCLHEQACTIAAEAYYKISGKVGIVLVTAGPGISNISTGLLSANVDRIPIIILTGQAQSKYLLHRNLRIYGPQAISASKLYDQIVPVLEVDEKTNYLKISQFLDGINEKSFCPRIIQVPLDLQKKVLKKNIVKKNNKNKSSHFNLKNKEKLKKILIDNFAKSKRPVILIGGGLSSEKGRKEVLKFSKKNNIPITLSWTAKDLLSNSDKNFCGLPGYFCNRAANAALYFSDLIITIGSRLDPLQMGFQTKETIGNKKLIIIDIDKEELSKHEFSNQSKVRIDGIEALRTLDSVIFKNKISKKWTKLMRESFLESQDEMVKKNIKKGVDPFDLLSSLSEINCDTFVAGSSGGSAEISFLNYRIRKNQRFINSPGLGSMGFAIPSVVGALEANKKSKIICVVGDGGLQMNIQELASISRYKKRKVLIVVLNNSGYDSMRRSLKKYFGEAFFVDKKSGLNFPDLELISNSYGLDFFKLSNSINIKDSLSKIWKTVNKPSLLEVKTLENIESFPKLSPKMNEDGSITSGSLIDCSPERPLWYKNLSTKIKDF